jgi:hypothetical protein
MKYQNIREEELKNKIAQDYFWLYDCTKIIGNVDFCVSMYQSQPELFEQESLLWAEAKKGASDIYKSIVQLILTIGKARTFDKYLPPTFLGAFDAEKIAFIPYNDIHEVFYINDFNWNVAPSNYDTKEFKLIYEKVKTIIDSKALLFNFIHDDRELKEFIRRNFAVSKSGLSKIKIDKNNFIVVYNKWLKYVKPTIAIKWENAKKIGLIDGDFYLADLLSQENMTLKEKLFILLKKDHYELDRGEDDMGLRNILNVHFTDKQVAHSQFWNKYERPPKEQYWDYIVERRDLLVPQDIRERKGSFFTPQIWVELSQQYLAEVLGQDWQDEYYIWDCAAGTGNLLNGLVNKYNIFASTIDQQDVDVMHDRISNGANLLHEHVFQFDFLNDEFLPKSKGGKLPDRLYEIIQEKEKRKKLVIYINPPYAEAGNSRAIFSKTDRKDKVSKNFKVHQKFLPKIGSAANEVFALFMAQVYENIPNCILAQFSTLKFVQGSNFRKFKEFFKAKFLGGFVVPANTFDNVKGSFPIGFTIWNTATKEKISYIQCDVYDANRNKLEAKTFYGNLPENINKWIKEFDDKQHKGIGFMSNPSPDFQQNNYLYIRIEKGVEHVNFWNFTAANLIEGCIYFAVRHCIEAIWLNDRDQFLYPNDGWQTDTEFQNDCLAFTLFHNQNKISSKDGTNHWIPFTEYEVDAKEKFSSNFMSNFIKGKLKPNGNGTLYEPEKVRTTPLEFSPEAKALFDAGRELWKYYHSQEFPTSYLAETSYNPDASLYDIKEHFQGRNEKGKMNNKSTDETYNSLITNLREKLKQLAEKIEPKVYQYGFLKQ